MGRYKPTLVFQPQAFRKDARAKQAKAIINKSIPALLVSDARARRGIESAELISDPPPNEGGAGSQSPSETTQFNISIHTVDTITAALRLQMNSPKATVGVLNMASPLRPGGGVLNGATSQEEFLCVRTTLYPSLHESFYRLPELGGVWTPDVLIFRDGTSEGNNLVKGERKYIGVVSSAMLRFPEVEEHGSCYSNSSEGEMAEKKMRAVMRIFQAKNIDSVVLGAWGCGAYGNPVKEIAKAWKKVLQNDWGKNPKDRRNLDRETWGGIRQVVFAINDINIAKEFAQYFGQELVMENVTDEGFDERGSDQNAQAIDELKSRIEGLEAQIPNIRADLLRHRLHDVLVGLKLQLAGRMALCESSNLIKS
ncbi:hypothetical protein LOZ66_004953 [Ophidiomyces ophidiicola]|nr:hypothetical protein LOZ66_004953 [Ophidiomyces ophidiicola]